MGSKRKVIDKEFKINAVQYRKEHPELTYTEIADHLGVSVSSLNRRVKQFDSNQNEDSGDQSRLFRGSGNYSSDDAKELARLRKENKDLKDAIEVLKKAMRIVSSQ